MVEVFVLTLAAFCFVELSHTSISVLFFRIMSYPVQFTLSLIFFYLIVNLVYIRFGRKITYRFVGVITMFLGVANAFTAKVNDKFFSILDFFMVKGKGDLFVLFVPVFMKPLFFMYIALLLVFLYLTFHVYSDMCKLESEEGDFFLRMYRKVGLYRKFWLMYEPVIQRRKKTLTTGILAVLLCMPQMIGNNSQFLFAQMMKDMKVVHTYAEPTEIIGAFTSQKNTLEEELELPERYKNADVIVIQSETFFDVSKLQDVDIREDVTKHFRSYQNEGIHGEVFVPVVGGLTCNSEFEFLTGINIKELNHIDIPYERMPLNELPSLAWDYADRGYRTVGIHGYEGEFFRRDQVYPLLGIGEFITVEDLKNKSWYGPWLKDEVIFDRISEILDENPEEKKFIYAVTMQNHGPYQDTPSNTVRVDNLTENDRQSFTNYVTGLSISDQALYEFMEKLRERERDTIVVFYGDHIIGVNHDLVSEDSYFRANLNNRYKTDYFVWHNHGGLIPQKKDISLMALGRLTKHLTMDWSYFDTFVWNRFNKEKDYFKSDDYLMDPSHMEENKAYGSVVNSLLENKQRRYEEIYEKNKNH